MADAIADVLRARRIEVLDNDGVVRAAIYCGDTDDCVFIELATPKGSGKLYLFACRDGVGVQAWSRGNEVASAGAWLDGTSTVSVHDPRTMAQLLSASTKGTA